MKMIGKIAQIIFDMVVGLASYYILTTFGVTGLWAVVVTLLITAIFAEFCEVRWK